MKRKLLPSLYLAALFTVAPGCQHPSEGDAVVAQVNGQPITMAELDRTAGKDLFRLREAVLQRAINDRLLEDAAKKAKLTKEQYLKQELEKRAPDVTESEAKGFFDRNGEHISAFDGKSFADVKSSIIQHLTQERREKAATLLADDLRNQAEIRVSLHPVVKMDPIGPSRGPADAKVTIVEFTDFQCPVCTQGRQLMDRFLKEYDGKIRVVFRDYPIALHPQAKKAAEAGHCADEQGKFWPLHDYMFNHPEGLGVDELKAEAGKLGMDAAKFATCLDTGKFEKAVNDNIKAAEVYGVTGAPSFFINGVMVEGLGTAESFKAEINRALAK